MPQRDLVMVEKSKQKISSSTLYIHAFASVVLQYHTKVLYSFEVGTHKFRHPFKAVSSTSHTQNTLFQESQVPEPSPTGGFVAD